MIDIEDILGKSKFDINSEFSENIVGYNTINNNISLEGISYKGLQNGDVVLFYDLISSDMTMAILKFSVNRSIDKAKALLLSSNNIRIRDYIGNVEFNSREVIITFTHEVLFQNI